jgi:hypothetical protein
MMRGIDSRASYQFETITDKDVVERLGPKTLSGSALANTFPERESPLRSMS